MKVELIDLFKAIDSGLLANNSSYCPDHADIVKTVILDAIKLAEARRTANVIRQASDILSGHFPAEVIPHRIEMSDSKRLIPRDNDRAY